MTKLAVFVCIFLVAIANHGVRAGFLGDRLADADKAADAAIEKAEQALAAVKGTTDMLTEKVRGMVDMTIEGVRKQVTGAVDMVDNKILEIIGASNDPKVSECAELAGTLHDTADAKVANVSHCAVEKLEEVDEYIQSIYNIIEETLSEIKLMKEELKNCTTGVSGFKQIMGAFICVDKVAVKAIFLTAKKIPKIAAYVIEVEAFVNTLPTSLATCVAKAGILTFLENAGSIVIGVKDCISEVIKGTTTQSPELPEAPELPENPLGDKKQAGSPAFPMEPEVQVV